METSSPYRPRVSRETRSLLTAGVMAVAALWLLARMRFPEHPVTPNPVPSVLSQLVGRVTYLGAPAHPCGWRRPDVHRWLH